MNNTTTPSTKLFRDDLKSLFGAYKGQMLRITFLSGFLLFLLNILIGISFYGQSVNTSLKDKLGMYFYIKDDPAQEGQIYKQVLNLKEKLQEAGLYASFSTKEDALVFLQKRLPDLTGSFQKFGIKNPLPATLYVTFHNQSQYQVLQELMYENKHIILNIQDLSQANNLHQQEQRVVNIIKLSNFIQVLCLVLVGVLAAVILSFAVFFLRGIFTAFRKDIQVKKLMGATKSQIIQPFLWSIVYAIIGGFIISLWLTVGSLAIFDYYMVQVFERSVMEYVQGHWLQIGGAFLAELVGIIGLLTMISYHFISSLHKKLR